jgi:hypothetical protein
MGQTKTVLYLAVNQKKESNMGLFVLVAVMFVVLLSLKDSFRK